MTSRLLPPAAAPAVADELRRLVEVEERIAALPETTRAAVGAVGVVSLSDIATFDRPFAAEALQGVAAREVHHLCEGGRIRMRRLDVPFAPIRIVLVLLGAALVIPSAARAHCDAIDGPLVAAAVEALQRGEVTPALRWVGPEDEQAIRDVFATVKAVRALGPEARELADRHFFETLIRIHRQGEGAPYSGLKPAGSIDPGIALADQALAAGTPEQLIETLGRDVGRGIRERFARVLRAQAARDGSVAAGRAWVEAYVDFIHHAEGLQRAARGPAEPHGGVPPGAGRAEARR